MRSRLASLGHVFRNGDLRRLELAWAAFYTGEWALAVALAVFAYEAGGATAVGVVGFARMMPAAIAVPFAAALADRHRRERVLLGVHAVRALAVGVAAAVLFAGGPAVVVYSLAAVAAVAATPFRPAQWALLPALARTPRELVAANVSSSTLEGLAGFAGPAFAAVLLAVRGPDVVFATAALAFLLAAVLVAGVSAPERADVPPAAPGAEILEGVRVLAAQREPRLLIGLFSAQTLVRGLLNVLIVVTALELLGLGESGVGVLNSAFGVGGLAGALAGLSLVDRRALARPFGLGLVLWGAPIAVIGLWAQPAVALVCLAVVGAGNSLLDVAGFTLVQRTVDDSVLARVFGVLETCAIAAVGLGAVLTPALIAGLGTRLSLVLTGALLPLLALIFRRRLDAIDAGVTVPERELSLLRSLPIFAPLPSAALELLARRAVPVATVAGTTVVRQGDPGDLFYVVAEGRLRVDVDGARVGTLGRGDSFGEIALLKDVPRTASVTALTDGLLYALDRDAFVATVTGHARSARSAEEVMSSRLGAGRVPTAPL